MKKFLKSSLSLILAITIIFSSAIVGFSEIDFGSLFAVKTQAASTSDLTFSLSSDGTYYFVTGCNTSASGSLTIPSTYNGKPVARIRSYAFQECTSLTSITIPDSVIRIGDSAFYNCSGLTTVTIPDSVTTIGSYAFSGCTSLTAITIPDSVTTIGDYSFARCTSLTTITIPDRVASIPEGAFCNCSKLISITIRNGVKTIGDYAFGSCTSLTTITIPDNVTSIGGSAFKDCSKLTSVTIPDSVISIGDSVFYNCSGLTTITIPDSVTSIGEAVFKGCTSLESITLPFVGSSRTANNSYSAVFGYIFGYTETTSSSYTGPTYQYCFNDYYYYYYYIPSSLKTVIITDATRIPCNAFYNCKNLTKICIQNKVTSIANYAFYNCKNLTKIYVPNKVTSIANYAFYNCSNLQNVYYGGNANQKSNINIGSYNSSLTNSTWYYDKCITFGDHTYTNDCDVTCNVCEQVRTITHTYDNACDTQCNVCSETRTTTHVYDNNCDTQCNVCSETRTTTHVYDNACDSVCNVCGNTRTVGKHKVRVTSNISVSNATSYPFSLGSNGVYSSTNKANSSSSTFTITALDDCVLKIDYYTSTESNYDYLKINHNSTNIVSVSGSTSWQTKSIELSEGDKVYITYSKDGSQASGSDTVYFKFATTSFDLVDFDSVESTCDETIYCDICGEIAKNSFNHTYSTAYHTTCNVCGKARSLSSSTATYGVFTYRIDPDENGGAITITDVDTTATGKVTVPTKIDNISVIHIGYNAFKDCTSITSVTIPDSITSIGYYAFYGCESLTSITIPDSVTSISSYAFENCISLTSITIPNSVTSIGEAAFKDCTSLESITLPFVGSSRTASNTYDAVFGYIFGYVSSSYSGTTCQYYSSSSGYYYYNIPSSLKTVIITDATQIPYGAFYNCANLTSITIPNSVTTISSYAFYNCANLTSITIPNSVTSIGNYAFYGCESLTSITIPDSVTSIGVAAFMGCTSLTLVTIPDSVTTISSYAFYNCANLTSITIPNSVTTISSDAFYNCSALSTVYYDGNINQKNNISIGSYNSCLTNAIWHIKCTTSDKHTYSTDFDNKCNVCEYVRVVESATKTYGVFTCCINPDENRGTITITDVSETAMGAISVPSEIGGYKVVCIGSNAFENCTSITSITIPNTVKSIESYAFYGCSRLTSLTIPDSVEAMGNYMLSGCTGLLELKLPFIDRKFSYLFGENQYEISNDYVPRSLKQITISSGDIAGSSFSGCNNISVITLGDKVTSIGDSAFYACNSITKVTIGNAVKTIGASAFQDCVSLTQVTIGKSVETIGTAAFKNCKSLLKVSIPNSTTKIKDSAFENCYNLATLTLGSKVDQIGNYSFRNCWRLTGVAIPDSTTLIGSGAFQDCSSLKKVAFGKNVTTIFDYAFEGCSELENIILPSSATSIGEYAFSNCSSLKRATIRGRTNHINNGTFEGCSSLVTVAFPKNVTTIAYNAFNCCYSLKEVWYEGSKADKNQILVAAGNSYIQDANWYYSSFDTVTHKYSTVCDEECDICGEIRTVNNHESDAGTVTKNATYTATGIMVYKCTVCGEVLETAVIPQLKPATPKLTKVVNTASGAQITWSASEGADNYIVYRRSYNATTKQWSGWSKLKEGVTSTYYLDETVKSGTYYRYTVRATNEGGISGYNTSGLKTYFLSTPKATTANSNSGVTVKWGKVTGATGYIVYRKTGNGKWQNLGKTTGTTFTDKTAKAGVTYRYTVKAYYSSYVSAFNTNGFAVRRLTTPTLKSVTSAKAGVTFKWNKVTGATGYTIYRKTGNGGWVKLATVTGNSTVSYLDKTAKKGVTYKYTVRAYYGTSTSYYNTKGLSIKDKY